MQKLLSKKYHKEFQVGVLTELDRMTWMDEIRYGGDVVDVESGKTFYAKISKDKRKVYDDYPKTIYEDEIERRLDEICEQYPEIEVKEKYYKFFCSEDVWDSMDQLDDYLEQSTSLAFLTIEITKETEEEAARLMTQWIEELKQNHFQYSYSCDLNINSKHGSLIDGSAKGWNVDEYDQILGEIKGVLKD